MVDYVQTFVVDGRRFGIEDQEAPGDHFFPHHYKDGLRKRFSCWMSGGGFGQHDTLEEARQSMAQYIRLIHRGGVEKAAQQTKTSVAILDRLTFHGLDSLMEKSDA